MQVFDQSKADGLPQRSTNSSHTLFHKSGRNADDHLHGAHHYASPCQHLETRLARPVFLPVKEDQPRHGAWPAVVEAGRLDEG